MKTSNLHIILLHIKKKKVNLLALVADGSNYHVPQLSHDHTLINYSIYRDLFASAQYVGGVFIYLFICVGGGCGSIYVFVCLF